MATYFSFNQKWKLQLLLLLTAGHVLCSLASHSSVDTLQKYHFTNELSSEHSILMKNSWLGCSLSEHWWKLLVLGEKNAMNSFCSSGTKQEVK